LPTTPAVVAAATPSKLADYYELTKPRMNFLIVITTTVGFYMAATADTPWLRLVHTAIGTFLCAACAATANQFIERGYDALMPRTKNRPLPTGRLNLLEALLFGAACGIIGFLYLFLFVNPLTAFLGALTVVLYVFVYTPMKRVSSLNTIVGAIPGAIPPVMGFTAAQGHISAQALAIFGILFLWQMPHFWALALRYRADYAAGGFPMVSERVGVEGTARLILLYALGLTAWSLAAPTFGLGGPVALIAAAALGGRLIWLAAKFARQPEDQRGWLSLFLFSNFYLLLLFLVLVVERLVRHALL
jgi:protoheme IX farnesyltransferase